jgi:hypothetical protein
VFTPAPCIFFDLPSARPLHSSLDTIHFDLGRLLSASLFVFGQLQLDTHVFQTHPLIRPPRREPSFTWGSTTFWWCSFFCGPLTYRSTIHTKPDHQHNYSSSSPSYITEAKELQSRHQSFATTAERATVIIRPSV